jgi:hypothetical protein
VTCTIEAPLDEAPGRDQEDSSGSNAA